MTKTPGSIETLSEEMKDLLFVLNEEADLPAVLLGTAYVDQCLGTLIKRKIGTTPLTKRLLSNEKGELGEYMGRADIVFSLGLIARPIHEDLKKIAEIRNHFTSGSLMTSFTDPQVIALCNELVLIRLFDEAWFKANIRPPDQGGRTTFCLTVAFICQRLLIDAFGPRIEKPPAPQ
jgi:hypothetical protein